MDRDCAYNVAMVRSRARTPDVWMLEGSHVAAAGTLQVDERPHWGRTRAQGNAAEQTDTVHRVDS